MSYEARIDNCSHIDYGETLIIQQEQETLSTIELDRTDKQIDRIDIEYASI